MLNNVGVHYFRDLPGKHQVYTRAIFFLQQKYTIIL